MCTASSLTAPIAACRVFSSRRLSICARPLPASANSSLQPGRALIRGHARRASRARQQLPSTVCQASAAEQGADLDDAVEVDLKVDGMVCDACSSRVHKALVAMEQIKKADVSLETGIVKLLVRAPSFSDAWNELAKVVAEVQALGFEAEPYFSDSEEDAQ